MIISSDKQSGVNNFNVYNRSVEDIFVWLSLHGCFHYSVIFCVMPPDQSPAQHICTVVTGNCWQDIIWSVCSTEYLALRLQAQFPRVRPPVFRSCPSIWRMNLFVRDLNSALRRSEQRNTSASSRRSRKRRPVKTGSVRWWSLNAAETEPKVLLISKWVIKFVMICMLFFSFFFFEAERMLREQEEDILNIISMFEKVNQELEACGGLTSQASSQRVSVKIQVSWKTQMQPLYLFYIHNRYCYKE